ncbi:MAG: N-formylglutamate amidohydrolase [Candidatus Lokiarchaeota archaeon]|nr:N-formylglutamate amidohydrolase [Candidatus Lokiarchaeota archaeon]
MIFVNIKDYFECRKGTIPLIFSVPHGGSTKFDKIPDRINGIHGVDKDTVRLAFDLIENINKIFQLNSDYISTPSYLISKIKRVKIDFNRKESEAYYPKSILAREIYQSYHNKIHKLISYNLNKFKRSLLIDIHGFEKAKRPKGFRDVELVLGTNNLKTMFKDKITKQDRDRNFRGKIVKKFNELNISIAPGLPKRREYVLTGGHIVQKYGASRIKDSQAIQIEFSDTIRLYDEELREKALNSLAHLLFEECKFEG